MSTERDEFAAMLIKETGLGKPKRTTKGFGWIPDLPDQRDHKAFFALHRGLTLPFAVSLRVNAGPIYDQGNIGSCHDSETDVLTDSGWRKFAELNGSERLATVNPETAELTYEVPSRIVRFPFTGELVCGTGRFLNFRVTPDHKMLLRKWNERDRRLNDQYEFVDAKDIGWNAGLLNRVVWNGESRAETFTLPGIPHKLKEQRLPKHIPMAAWLRFLGIYLAEGTMLKRDQRLETISYKIQIAASKPREKAFVRETLKAIGVIALELGDRFTFHNKRIYEAMSSLGLEQVKAGKKFVPAFVFRQSAAMIREFLAGHFAGDGCETTSGRAHYTGSRQLADDLQTLIFLSGNEARLGIRMARGSKMADGRTVTSYLDEHRISVCERKHLSIDKKESIHRENYDGDVFCAEVPTHHTLVTRREGCILVSGNCTAQAIAAAIVYEEKKQKLPEIFPSRLFIYYNERVIENSVSSDAGAEIRDGIKSVVSQGVCPETSWGYEHAFDDVPWRKCYAQAQKGMVKQYLRLDPDLNQMQTCLAAGFPFIVGFTVYESFQSDAVASSGQVPMPGPDESVIGGHAVLCLGYDNASQTFLLQNSWGTDWGMQGFFTMPYAYLTDSNLAGDFWSIRMV